MALQIMKLADKFRYVDPNDAINHSDYSKKGSLQWAINLINSAGGGKLVLAPGNFPVTSDYITLCSNIEILGRSGGVIGDADCVLPKIDFTGAYGGSFYFNNITNVKLSGIILYIPHGYLVNQPMLRGTGGNLIFENLIYDPLTTDVPGSGDHFISLTAYGTNPFIVIKNCSTAINSSYRPNSVDLTNFLNVNLLNNYISVYYNCINLLSCNNVRIINNKFLSRGSSDPSQAPLVVNSCSNINVINNIIGTAGATEMCGIIFSGVNHGLILSNKIGAVIDYEISLSGCDDITALYNILNLGKIYTSENCTNFNIMHNFTPANSMAIDLDSNTDQFEVIGNLSALNGVALSNKSGFNNNIFDWLIGSNVPGFFQQYGYLGVVREAGASIGLGMPTGGFHIWRDTSNNKTYLVVNDGVHYYGIEVV